MRNVRRHMGFASGWMAVCLLCLLSVSGRARADTAVLVPPHVEQGVLSEQVEVALDALARALKVDGFNVVLPGQAGPAAEDAQDRKDFPAEHDPLRCVTPECATAFKKLFDGTFAVQLSLFREPGHAVSLTVVIVESANVFFSGASTVEGGDIAGSLRDAYRQAREHQAEGVGPWLTVTGTPEGAIVYVDGSEFGRLPIKRRRLEPGVHRLVLHADGFTSVNDTVDMPERIDHEESRSFTLEATDSAAKVAAPAPQARAKRSWIDYSVGGAALALGATFLSVGIYQSMTEGDCAERRDDGSCARNYTSDGFTVGNYVGGALGIAAGVATLWVGPFSLWLNADSDSAQLRARTQF